MLGEGALLVHLGSFVVSGGRSRNLGCPCQHYGRGPVSSERRRQVNLGLLQTVCFLLSAAACAGASCALDPGVQKARRAQTNELVSTPWFRIRTSFCGDCYWSASHFKRAALGSLACYAAKFQAGVFASALVPRFSSRGLEEPGAACNLGSNTKIEKPKV